MSSSGVYFWHKNPPCLLERLCRVVLWGWETDPFPFLLLLLMYRKEYPVISKNMVRQRLISSQSNLAGKLGAGVLSGHPQVLSSYQYETGVTLSNAGPQDPISNHFPQNREPSLLYHCFKHRGMFFATVQQSYRTVRITTCPVSVLFI